MHKTCRPWRQATNFKNRCRAPGANQLWNSNMLAALGARYLFKKIRSAPRAGSILFKKYVCRHGRLMFMWCILRIYYLNKIGLYIYIFCWRSYKFYYTGTKKYFFSCEDHSSFGMRNWFVSFCKCTNLRWFIIGFMASNWFCINSILSGISCI